MLHRHMFRWQYVMLGFVPLAVGSRLLNAPPLATFLLAAIALVPLAGLIGRATEELAHHLGPRYGGLLNATFGNAAELIITTFAIREGLLTLVKASITGSIIGNTLLVLGGSLLAGGLRNGIQRYDARAASLNSAMMLLALAGLFLPATVALTVHEAPLLEEVSLLVAGILLLTYVAYLIFTFQRGQGKPEEALVGPIVEATAPEEGPVWSRRRALVVLALATVGAAVVSPRMASSRGSNTRFIGWPRGMLRKTSRGATKRATWVLESAVIARVTSGWLRQANCTALKCSAAFPIRATTITPTKNSLQPSCSVTGSITADSSTQVALFVAPLLVFLSIPLGHPMNLVFEPLELAILGLTTAVFAYICLDGESNWLEGVQLLALYLMAAAAFFFLPIAGGG